MHLKAKNNILITKYAGYSQLSTKFGKKQVLIILAENIELGI